MAKMTLLRPSFTEVEVEIPTTCPHCGTSLDTPGSIAEWDLVDAKILSHIEYRDGAGMARTPGQERPGDVPVIEGEGYTETGDEYYPNALWCAYCDKEIVGAGIIWTGERRGLPPV